MHDGGFLIEMWRVGMNEKISLMIIGAPKSATSSLKEYLGGHPDVITHAYREMNFFLNDDEFEIGFDSVKNRYFINHGKEILLAKSVGVMYSDIALHRMREHNPNMKLVVVLRNPIDRAYSAYWFARRQGWENIENFEEAIFAPLSRFGGNWIKISGCSYLEHGLYEKYLERVIAIFGKDALLAYSLEELKENFLGVSSEILDSVKLNPVSKEVPEKKTNQAAYARSTLLASLLTSQFGIKRYAAKFIPWTIRRNIKTRIQSLNEVSFTPLPMKAETRNQLRCYFADSNARLGNLLKKTFNW